MRKYVILAVIIIAATLVMAACDKGKQGAKQLKHFHSNLQTKQIPKNWHK